MSQEQQNFDAFLSDNPQQQQRDSNDLSGSSFAPIAATPQYPPSSNSSSNFSNSTNPGYGGTAQEGQKLPIWKRCFSCVTSLSNITKYQSYFDVDTSDVTSRIVGSVRFFNEQNAFWDKVLAVKGNDDGAQMADGGNDADAVPKGPDAYGPFWIATTLIFFVAVTSNISNHFHQQKGFEEDFEYDIYLLIHAVWILYIFSFGVPLALYTAFYCLFSSSANNSIPSFMELFCLYGYSLVPFVFASILCGVLPFSWIQWIVILMATAFSLVFVLRNMVGFVLGNNTRYTATQQSAGGEYGSDGSASVGSGQSMRVLTEHLTGQNAKAAPILAFVIGCHVILMLTLKLGFYHHIKVQKL